MTARCGAALLAALLLSACDVKSAVDDAATADTAGSDDDGDDGDDGDDSDSDSDSGGDTAVGDDTAGDTGGSSGGTCADVGTVGLCDPDELCDGAAGSHCFVIGSERPIQLAAPTIDRDQRFAPLRYADIRVGVTLQIDGMETIDGCSGELGTIAKAFTASVISVNLSSSDPDADAYLEEIESELEAKGTRAAIKFLAGGSEVDPQFQAGFAASMPPGHMIALIDGTSYDPECRNVDAGSTVTGSAGILRLGRVSAEGESTNEIKGMDATYALYPMGR